METVVYEKQTELFLLLVEKLLYYTYGIKAAKGQRRICFQRSCESSFMTRLRDEMMSNESSAKEV